MPALTVATFNIEWMNRWFTTDDDPVAFRTAFDDEGVSNDPRVTAGRAAAVIRAIDPDVLAIQEGPSRDAELRLFVEEFLSDAGVPRYEWFLGDGGQQKLALLYKPGVVTATLPAPADITLLTDPFPADVDCNAELEDYSFTRTPLVVNLQVGGASLQVIVLHTKSSFVNRGEELWQNPATRQEYVVASLLARRRNAAEGMRLRTYLDSLLAAQPDVPVIVVGDLNDGPGADYFEERYLARGVVDAIIGTAFIPEWQFVHALYDMDPALRFTAIFSDFVTGEVDKLLLLDHVLLSPALRRELGSGTIHHAAHEAQLVNSGVRRQDRPSDHRPASVKLLL
ncbi:MAG: endonuclease/exonuclease/phosphatase family protein [Chloroflexota bacterium]|nr:endonuclease/exonuclease/phosphatase family protein [Chloroflexota bacterium]